MHSSLNTVLLLTLYIRTPAHESITGTNSRAKPQINVGYALSQGNPGPSLQHAPPNFEGPSSSSRNNPPAALETPNVLKGTRVILSSGSWGLFPAGGPNINSGRVDNRNSAGMSPLPGIYFGEMMTPQVGMEPPEPPPQDHQPQHGIPSEPHPPNAYVFESEPSDDPRSTETNLLDVNGRSPHLSDLVGAGDRTLTRRPLKWDSIGIDHYPTENISRQLFMFRGLELVFTTGIKEISKALNDR